MKALITGATSGIGKEIAVYLHSLGYELILTGRNEAAIAQMAREFGTKTRYIALDLSDRQAPFLLYRFCKGQGVDFLVNNAGFGVHGEFMQTSLEDELSMLDVNVRAVHILTKLFLRDFVRQGNGRILNVASVAGFMTGPLMAGYYASKNYVVRLSLAIREELRRRKSPVTISVLCPGPVDTNFNRRAGVSFGMPSASAQEVAKLGVDGALRGKAVIIPKLLIKLSQLGSRFGPLSIQARMTYDIQKKKRGVRADKDS